LRQWAIRDSAGNVCELVDIGANLVKVNPENLANQLARCAVAGVSRILVTGTSVTGSERALELVRRSSEMQPGVRLFCTAGVHPHDARTCDGRTLEALRALARNSECVAIGECGLDYDRMFSRREVQLEWFERQARLAAELDMPLFVHERDLEADKGAPLGSAADLIRILGFAGVRPERVCVHCFTGCHEVLTEYVKCGYRIGLTGFVAMRERGAHVREAIAAGLLPLSRVLIETDSPFMKPDKTFLPDVKSLQRGQNEPCNVPAVARALAELYDLPVEQVAKQTTANACEFFRLTRR
jgi:TatD DNase family protein